MSRSYKKPLYLPPRGASRKSEEPARDSKSAAPPIDARDLGAVGRDDLGNAVWNWHPKIPGRRSEDPTIDYLQALEIDGLSIDDEMDESDAAATHAFNPYDHD